MKCFNCQQDGHIASNCHYQDDLADPAGNATPWCGQCDPKTRHIIYADRVVRCPDCHPKRGEILAQYRRCKNCRTFTYAWDDRPCGSHQHIGPRDYVGSPPAPALVEPRGEAARQVAEFRAARVVPPPIPISGSIPDTT